MIICDFCLHYKPDGECGLGLRFGFRAAHAAREREHEKQRAAQKLVHGFERGMKCFVCGDGGEPAASRCPSN